MHEMTDEQFNRLMSVLGVQLGVTIGCFVALLILIYFTGTRR